MANEKTESDAESAELPLADYYPDYLMPFAGRRELHHQRFDELREQMLIGYGYNTARAYWGDLDGLYWWAAERDRDVLDLSDNDVTHYLALLRRRKYSENTVRRKRHTIERFRRLVTDEGDT